MPNLPDRICACGKRVAYGTKCACVVKREQMKQQARPSAFARGYTKQWARESKAFLTLPGHDRCACGCGRKADMVDHRIAHKGDMGLFWDRSNWQPMNRRCNSRKAVASEGGFGHRGVGSNFGAFPGDHPRPTTQEISELEFFKNRGSARR